MSGEPRPADSQAARTPIPLGRRLAYATPAISLALVGIPLYVTIPKFYTDVVGADIVVVGALLLGVRIFDAVSDPVVGTLSDRTTSRLGRRRPWIAAGAPLLALATLALFSPPTLTAGAAAIWFGFSVFAVFFFWTVIAVPYEALGPELTFDYDERTSLLGLRDGFLILGTLGAAASPALVALALGLGSTAADERTRFTVVAWLYAAAVIVTCAIGFLGLREPTRPAPPETPTATTGGGWLGTLRNRPFAILLASYTVNAIGSNLPGLLIPYYIAYILGGGTAELYLLIYFVAGILMLPVWVRLSQRFEKKNVWIAAAVVNTGSFALVFLLGPGDHTAYGVLVAFSGLGFGATIVLPNSMQADVIDYEHWRTGERREGRLIGIWAIARKLAAALGAGLALPVLGLAGYVPNVEQTETVRLVLRVLYAGVPCVCSVLGMLIVITYPIDRAAHTRILAAVAARAAGRRTEDPLASV